jgi:RNA polymerase sigma-70 factor (ECF subfamily)
MASTTTPRGGDCDTGIAPDDAALIQLAADGDERAFATLFHRHVRAVRGYLAVRVGAQAAEDLVVETFAAAWTAGSRFDPKFGSARPWLYGIATNQLRRHRELERSWQRSLTAEATNDVRSLADPPSEPGSDPKLIRAMTALDPRERDVLLLVALAELKVSEAAVALGISPVAARLRLHRARRKLVTDLRSDHDA